MTEKQQGPTIGVHIREVSLLSIHCRKAATRKNKFYLPHAYHLPVLVPSEPLHPVVPISANNTSHKTFIHDSYFPVTKFKIMVIGLNGVQFGL